MSNERDNEIAIYLEREHWKENVAMAICKLTWALMKVEDAPASASALVDEAIALLERTS